MTRKSGKKNTGREKEEMNTDQKGTKKSPLQTILKGTHSEKKAATYSPALHCSTIGDDGLNFSVRNGKRWEPAAIAT